MLQTISYIKTELKELYSETEIASLTRYVLTHITKKSYASILARDGLELLEANKRTIENIVKRLQNYEPIQYILGETEFFGMPFFVNPYTLIPRPETEELVELVLQENKQKSLSVLDIGTGSGCIAVSLARHLDESSVTGWDVSLGALETASKNASRNNVSVHFEKVDVLKAYLTDKKYDIIVSNPPYVLDSEKTIMEQNVLAYEPHSALFVPDNAPLLFYERIADIATQILKQNGKLYFEINRAMGDETFDLLTNLGFVNIRIFKDLSGSNRIVAAEY